MNSAKVIFVIGETASGKSDYAVRLALEHSGEVISADSRQVYCGLDIGSGKITKSEMHGVRHHLIDLAQPGDNFTLADYLPLAERAIKDITSRNKTAIVCGGTGLYIDGLLAGYNLAPQENMPRDVSAAKLRAGLSAEQLAGLSPSELNNHQHLAALAARGGKNLPPNWPDRRRPGAQIHYVHRGREQLRRRINDRVDSRMAQGMLEEVQGLIDSGVNPDWLISLGLEYRYLTKHILGELELGDALEQLQTAIWRFSAKQRNWIKRWPIDITIDNSES